jgi:hypothetical protein
MGHSGARKTSEWGYGPTASRFAGRSGYGCGMGAGRLVRSLPGQPVPTADRYGLNRPAQKGKRRTAQFERPRGLKPAALWFPVSPGLFSALTDLIRRVSTQPTNRGPPVSYPGDKSPGSQRPVDSVVTGHQDAASPARRRRRLAEVLPEGPETPQAALSEPRAQARGQTYKAATPQGGPLPHGRHGDQDRGSERTVAPPRRMCPGALPERGRSRDLSCGRKSRSIRGRFAAAPVGTQGCRGGV